MGSVITVRVPDEMKRNLEKYGVEASGVARKAFEEEIRRKQIEEAKKAAKELAVFLADVPTETIVEWIREDRRKR